jgi:hypothetical protein
MADEVQTGVETAPPRRGPGRPRKARPAEDGSEALRQEIARLKAELASQSAAPVTTSVKTPPAGLRAVYEMTQSKVIGGQKTLTLTSIDDPNSKDLSDLIDMGERGSVTVTRDGQHWVTFTTSAQAARDVMRACAKGTYNPFPAIKTSKRQELEAPRPVGGGSQ